MSSQDESPSRKPHKFWSIFKDRQYREEDAYVWRFDSWVSKFLCEQVLGIATAQNQTSFDIFHAMSTHELAVKYWHYKKSTERAAMMRHQSYGNDDVEFELGIDRFQDFLHYHRFGDAIDFEFDAVLSTGFFIVGYLNCDENENLKFIKTFSTLGLGLPIAFYDAPAQFHRYHGFAERLLDPQRIHSLMDNNAAVFNALMSEIEFRKNNAFVKRPQQHDHQDVATIGTDELDLSVFPNGYIAMYNEYDFVWINKTNLHELNELREAMGDEVRQWMKYYDQCLARRKTQMVQFCKQQNGKLPDIILHTIIDFIL